MHYNNRAARLRREILARIASLSLTDRLTEGIERVPYDMTAPGWETVRCCVHKDRAIIRLRIAARLGFDVGANDDVDRPLADYAREAMARTDPPPTGLFLLQEACNDCVASPYVVTDSCQGCLARPCSSNCPKKAIQIIGGRARLDASLCVGCGICAQACPYKAIIKVPVPCEEACPVGAISKAADGSRIIDKEACIDCGRCVRECPFGAVMEPSRLLEAISGVQSGRPVVALVAPATLAQFPGSPEQFSSALVSIGFSSVVEVAMGAEATSQAEALELEEHMALGKGPLATSCCPAWTKAARTALAPICGLVSSTPSPMVFTAMAVRKAQGQAILVFISPCLAKRREAEETQAVDLTLSTEELGAWFVASGTEIPSLPARPFDGPDGRPAARPANTTARGFGVSGGVAASVSARFTASGKAAPRILAVNGLDKVRVKELGRWATVPPQADLVEVMACEGGCVAGPCAIANPRAAVIAAGKYAQAGSESSPESQQDKEEREPAYAR